ncbi:MAG: hypothetical protein ACP5OV_01345 [Acidimicrobiales bacterium]
MLAAWPVGAASAGTPRVASVLGRAQHDMLVAGCVHLVVRTSSPRPSTIVADIGRRSGRETYRNGTAIVNVLVTPRAAYVRGNAAGLRQFVGLTRAQERRVGDRFVVMRAGTSQYSGFAANLTVASLAGLLPPSRGVAVHLAGAHRVVLSWTSTSSAGTSSTALTVRVGARVLPEVETVHGALGGGSIRFSRWGRVVRVGAPAPGRTIAYRAVTGPTSETVRGRCGLWTLAALRSHRLAFGERLTR